MRHLLQNWAVALSLLLLCAAGTKAQPNITPTSVPNGEATAPYVTQTLDSQDEADPTCCTWSFTGTMPPGLSLSNAVLPTATISGTPTTPGTFTFVVTATPAGTGGSQGYTVVISPGPSVAPGPLPAGEEGVPYMPTLSASNGTPPYTWSESGALPSPVMFSNGSFSGTPGAGTAGTYKITVTVTDFVGGTTGMLNYNIVINPPPSIAATALPQGEIGVAYPTTGLSASGGIGSYTWSVASGSLDGLSLNPVTGMITGTPTAPGTFPFMAQVTDSVGGMATQSFSLTVIGAPMITTTSPLPQGEVTAPYSQTLAASGGTGTGYTFSLVSGSLPAGLSPSAGGMISGTPTAAGTANFTMKVTDSAGGSGTQPFSLTIIAAPSITTGSPLPQGEVGAAYSQTLTASGGTNTGFTWSLASGSLPAGLAPSATGVISGIPTAAGTANFTMKVTDSGGGSGTLLFSLTIIPGPTITTAPILPNGTVGVPYAGATLSASGGTSPYTWSITSGSLPALLSLDGSTGAISGTPTASGTFNLTIQATDAKGVTSSKIFTITIAAGLTIVTAPTLPNGTINLNYSVTLSASGGTPPYTWTITSGALPSGVGINGSTGTIAGMPTSSGTFSFTVQVTDSASVTASKLLTLTIAQSLVITTASTLPSGSVGAPYIVSLSATGGTPAYSWTVTAGVLPAGLSLNAATGAINGAPTASGSFGFTVQVTDSSSVTTSKAFSISIVSGLTITTAAALPGGSPGVAYALTLAAAGGTPPYTWKLTGGALPGGLVLSSSIGSIAGTPSSAGTFIFTIQVTDNNSASASQQFSLTIASGLTITTASALPSGSLNGAYSATLAATGGTAPYRWAVSTGSLPSGVALNAATGVISGTPLTSGVFLFTAQVKDNAGATQSKQFSLTIAAGLVIATGATLPAGTLGQQYSLVLAASGGTQPYKWSVIAGAIAPGLGLNSQNGTVAGTPTSAGTFSFTVQVTDNSGAAASLQLSLTVVSPQVNVSGVPDSPQPAQQITLTIAPALAYSIDITGQITLTFQPDAVNPADDPSIQFSPSGRTASFTIPANSTSAVEIMLQTGTVAGTISLSFALEAGGVPMPSTALDRTIIIQRAVPAIQKVSVTTNSTGLQIQVLGLSTTRDLTEADVHFTAAAGANLQTTDVTISLSSVSAQWFQGATSTQFGGQYLLVLPFTASQGSVSTVASVSVVLKNAQGASPSKSASF